MKFPSPFGSHASMALDPLLQVILLGWQDCQTHVVLCDEHGTYVTERRRLDNGLADTNRHNYVGRRAA